MMRLILDKETADERELPLGRIEEQILGGVMNGSLTFKGDKYPDIEGFTAKADFESIDALEDGGGRIVISGEYNRISSLSVSYDDYLKSYTLYLTIVKAVSE